MQLRCQSFPKAICAAVVYCMLLEIQFPIFLLRCLSEIFSIRLQSTSNTSPSSSPPRLFLSLLRSLGFDASPEKVTFLAAWTSLWPSLGQPSLWPHSLGLNRCCLCCCGVCGGRGGTVPLALFSTHPSTAKVITFKNDCNNYWV